MDYQKGKDYYNSLAEDEQKLIDDIMLTTMCMCSELTNVPCVFFERVAYKIFKYEMLTHLLDNEYYFDKDKQWKKFK